MRSFRVLAAVAAFFVIAVVVSACGGTSVPSGSVASVAGNQISLRAVNHWMYVAAKGQSAQQAAQGQLEPVITASDPPKFKACITELRNTVPTVATATDSVLHGYCQTIFNGLSGEVMNYLIESYWYQADAHKLGIKYTAKAQQKSVAKATKQVGATKSFKAFVAETGQTKQDLVFQVRSGDIYTKLLKHFQKPVSKAEVAAYYKAHKSKFAEQPTRTGHVLVTKTKAQASAALQALHSGQSWDAVAKQFGSQASEKSNGAAVTAATPQEFEHAASKALFAAPIGQLVGPVKGVFGYYVMEAAKATKGVQHTLAQERKSVQGLVKTQNATKAKTKLDNYSQKHWGKTTLCATPYESQLCSNYKAPKTTTTPPAAPPPTTTTPTTTAPANTRTTGKQSTTATLTRTATTSSTPAGAKSPTTTSAK